MITRPTALNELNQKLSQAPIVAILGPRQCGKTTLAKAFIASQKKPTHFFDCENPRDLAKLQNPLLMLEPLTGLIVIDEIQLYPSLFNILRVLADQKNDQKFIILGSASQELVSKSADTLAGRIAFIELAGFLNTTPTIQTDRLWLRGGFPLSYLANTSTDSIAWRENFVRTFLERDIPRLGISVPSRTLLQFWTMLSHYHGQLCNYSALAKSMGISDNTIRHYLDILEGTYMVRLVRPWHYNTKKRLVKQPKLYIRDSGIFHYLQHITSKDDLLNHPTLGASWEGHALEQLALNLKKRPEEIYFWSTHSGAELDILIYHNNKKLGFEIKFNESPTTTRSMTQAITELELDHLYIIYPGKDTYPIKDTISTLPLHKLAALNVN